MCSKEIPEIDRIKDGYNPATWALELTTREQEEVLGVKFADVYKESDLYRRNQALIRELSTPPPDLQELHFPSKYSQSFFTQCQACVWKQYKSYWRNTAYSAVRLLYAAGVSIMSGILFWGVGNKRETKQEIFSGLGAMYTALMFLGPNSGNSVQPILASGRTVFYRERAAGMYSAFPYAIAQVAIEIPYTFAQSFISCVIVYSMIGYEWTAIKFFQYLFALFMTILSMVYYGMLAIGISPSLEYSFLLSGALHSTWNLFTGFVIPLTRIATWWRWFFWISPISWGFYGLAASQYGDIHTKLDTGETVAGFLKDYFGFRHDFMWVVCLALIGSCVFFASLFVVSLKVFNFQKR